ncbi:MAG TPA: arginyltransferase [Dissulfurispiraceae bacterium]|nr:arginyltransferase [Dissulfurispiraceae bacterium]
MLPDSEEVTFSDDFLCPYFSDGRIASVEYRIADADSMRHFQYFLASGYRRLGRTFYRNRCCTCEDCVPIRIPVAGFAPSRSQRRALKVNNDISVMVHPPHELNEERLDLFDRYLATKHPDPLRPQRDDLGFQLRIIHFGYEHTLEMNYYLGERLVGTGIIDIASDAVSANYFYYDTDFLKRRLGIFSILQEIALARALGKTYYYLGFLIRDNPKMAYKEGFVPHELLINGQWMNDS